MKTKRKILLNILEELKDEDFEQFKWELRQLDFKEKSPISQCKLERATRLDVVDRIVENYTESDSGEVMMNILEGINQNSLVEKLKKELRNLSFDQRPGMSEKEQITDTIQEDQMDGDFLLPTKRRKTSGTPEDMSSDSYFTFSANLSWPKLEQYVSQPENSKKLIENLKRKLQPNEMEKLENDLKSKKPRRNLCLNFDDVHQLRANRDLTSFLKTGTMKIFPRITIKTFFENLRGAPKDRESGEEMRVFEDSPKVSSTPLLTRRYRENRPDSLQQESNLRPNEDSDINSNGYASSYHDSPTTPYQQMGENRLIFSSHSSQSSASLEPLGNDVLMPSTGEPSEILHPSGPSELQEQMTDLFNSADKRRALNQAEDTDEPVKNQDSLYPSLSRQDELMDALGEQTVDVPKTNSSPLAERGQTTKVDETQSQAMPNCDIKAEKDCPQSVQNSECSSHNDSGFSASGYGSLSGSATFASHSGADNSALTEEQKDQDTPLMEVLPSSGPDYVPMPPAGELGGTLHPGGPSEPWKQMTVPCNSIQEPSALNKSKDTDEAVKKQDTTHPPFSRQEQLINMSGLPLKQTVDAPRTCSPLAENVRAPKLDGAHPQAKTNCESVAEKVCPQSVQGCEFSSYNDSVFSTSGYGSLSGSATVASSSGADNSALAEEQRNQDTPLMEVLTSSRPDDVPMPPAGELGGTLHPGGPSEPWKQMTVPCNSIQEPSALNKSEDTDEAVKKQDTTHPPFSRQKQLINMSGLPLKQTIDAPRTSSPLAENVHAPKLDGAHPQAKTNCESVAEKVCPQSVQDCEFSSYNDSVFSTSGYESLSGSATVASRSGADNSALAEEQRNQDTPLMEVLPSSGPDDVPMPPAGELGGTLHPGGPSEPWKQMTVPCNSIQEPSALNKSEDTDEPVKKQDTTHLPFSRQDQLINMSGLPLKQPTPLTEVLPCSAPDHVPVPPAGDLSGTLHPGGLAELPEQMALPQIDVPMSISPLQTTTSLDPKHVSEKAVSGKKRSVQGRKLQECKQKIKLIRDWATREGTKQGKSLEEILKCIFIFNRSEHEQYPWLTAEDCYVFQVGQNDKQMILVLNDKMLTPKNDLNARTKALVQYQMGVCNIQKTIVLCPNGNEQLIHNDNSLPDTMDFCKTLIDQVLAPVLAVYKKIQKEELISGV